MRYNCLPGVICCQKDVFYKDKVVFLSKSKIISRDVKVLKVSNGRF